MNSASANWPIPELCTSMRARPRRRCSTKRSDGDHIAEPQARHHDLRERAEIDHPLLAVERAQRGDHAVLMPEFGIVVVLDDPDIVAVGPVEQFQPPLQSHADAKRILMRRRHHDQLGVRRARDAFRDAKTLVVHRHRHELCAGGSQRPARLDKAGLLDPDLVAVIENHPAAEIERAGRAGGHHHLIRRADQTAHRAEKIRDLAAAKPAGRRPADRGSRCSSGILPGLAQQPRPFLERESWKCPARRG